MHTDLYADYLDVVKWSAVVELVGHYRIERVLYIPLMHGTGFFLSDRITVPKKYKSDLAKAAVAVDPRIHAFFSAQRALDACELGLSNLQGLASTCGFSLKIVPGEFTQRKRREYFSAACAAIRLVEEPTVVFLDPSTGLGINGCGVEHVSLDDVREVYAAMSAGSVLVVYQHMWIKSGQTLTERLDEARTLLRPALGVETFPSQRFGPMGLLHCKKPAAAEAEQHSC